MSLQPPQRQSTNQTSGTKINLNLIPNQFVSPSSGSKNGQQYLAQHFKNHIAKNIKASEVDIENRDAMKRVRNKMERRPTMNNCNYEDIMVQLNQEILSKFRKEKTLRAPSDSPMKGQMSHREGFDYKPDNNHSVVLKDKLKIKTNLDNSIGSIFGKGPSFEYPALNFSPITPSRANMLMDQVMKFNSMESPSKWKILGDVITNKFNQKLPIKEMIEQTHMKDKVFDKIYQKFAVGQKLKRYDLYMSEEVGRKEMKQLKQVVFESKEQQSMSFKNSKKLKQIQIQQTLASISKKAAQSEQEEKQATQSYMQTKKSKNHQLLAIKQAVDNREITLDEANEIILQHNKQLNEQLFKSVKDSKNGFDTILKDFKKRIFIKPTLNLNKSPRKYSISPDNRSHSKNSRDSQMRPKSATANRSKFPSQHKRMDSMQDSNAGTRKIESFHEPLKKETVKQKSSQSMLNLQNTKDSDVKSPRSKRSLVNIQLINQDIKNTVDYFIQQGKESKKQRPKTTKTSIKLKSNTRPVSISYDNGKYPGINLINKKYVYRDWRDYLYGPTESSLSYKQKMILTGKKSLKKSPTLRYTNRKVNSQMMHKLFYYPQDSNSLWQGNNPTNQSTEIGQLSKDTFQFINSNVNRINSNNAHKDFGRGQNSLNLTQFDTNQSESFMNAQFKNSSNVDAHYMNIQIGDIDAFNRRRKSSGSDLSLKNSQYIQQEKNIASKQSIHSQHSLKSKQKSQHQYYL
ncbi:UNKNOWN [Stylonychia lemnae]|uniref:Uncharacterized protein n=1 Tax=Stylonychia lemnae TaxID=5949 RepID=A0A078ALJ3_STYLE|nr:UNKNOWN [Stylonychia lemnae]|eukprot:CDW83094.1 UNKNOWN [Stylonychia lemnae]